MRSTRRRLLRLGTSGILGAAWSRSDRSGASTAAGPPRTDTLTQADEFDPVVHGFGFSNWEGNTGTGADGEEFTYEPSDVTLSDVRRAIEDSWTTALSEAQKAIMTRIVYTWIGAGAATNGHCYGMALAADHYFQNPSQLPDGVDASSEIPRPAGSYNAVGDRIRRLQTSQLLRAEVYWFALFGLRWGLADHRESLAHLTDAIDATGTGGLAITGEEYTHQVLAHEYERGDDVTDVFVYDPSYEAAAHENRDDVWTLSVDPETGEVIDIEDGYEEFLYHDPDVDHDVVDDVIGGRDRVLEHLSNAVFLGLETDGKLEIDVPGDAFVDRPTAEYADWDDAPYSDAAIVFGPFEEFTIAIDGADGGEYALDALGIRRGDLSIEEVLSGTLEEVPARFRFSIGEAGEFAVDAVEAEAAEVAEAVDEGEEVSWIEDHWWIVATGGALGLGAAYRLATRRSGDED